MSLESKERAAGVRSEFRPFMAALEADGGRWAVGVHGGVRTDADQAALWAKGRTTKGEPPYTAERPLGSTVTNARDGSSSAHHESHRAALDIWALQPAIARPVLLPASHSEWARLRAIGHAHGLQTISWDGPHFELSGWRSLPPESTADDAVSEGGGFSTGIVLVGVLVVGGGLWLFNR